MSKPQSHNTRRSATDDGVGAILLGRVKWFGGFNHSTGRENDYGFIEANNVDFFVHRSGVRSSLALMVEGAEVLFRCRGDRVDRPAAVAAHVLSGMTDEELVDVLNQAPDCSPDLVLTIAVQRQQLAPFRDEVLHALTALGAAKPTSNLLDRFWKAFTPSKPGDPLYHLAPPEVKSQTCRRHYAPLRHALLNLLVHGDSPPTSLPATEVYRSLDENDRRLAAKWAGSKEDAVVAKMLSARAAEKIAARLYREADAIVEDVAVTQLNQSGDDWITHDLKVDGTTAIDVKNARRPVNSYRFYVEHTVPRFKLDRSGADVRVAGVLSPYLQKRFIDDPSLSNFTIGDVVFLGETSRRDIDELVSRFRSPRFEVVRGNERMFPNWVFGHSERWYPGLGERMVRAAELCRDVPDDDWRYIVDSDEVGRFVAALCAMRVPLPPMLSDRLSDHQAEFCAKLQRNLDSVPAVPAIFLTLLSDFVDAVVDHRPDFSPSSYAAVLFPHGGSGPTHRSDRSFVRVETHGPLGAIDPLGLVAALVRTLTTLWANRVETALERFTNYRFGGLGLMQARGDSDVEWTTILAYCGGTEYQRDEDGNIHFSGNAPKVMGRCGNTPLIIGSHETCSRCRKLLCEKCGFCSIGCQEKMLQSMKRDRNGAARLRSTGFVSSRGRNTEEPPWESVPLDAYEDYFR
ncbi:hypothetical protein LQ954_12170 [Sphingomonas sp. IC-11]|uniref:cold-shock protein n=1 Tax=Sphingomonas sp. IC-11 TaxID=2898528 RepID=UPI001E3FBB47|nr:hypothetical protein [Sphingomonas sp. IC-11]MCD2316906.1 hypothetical protein [Sphingomonas sp. IC-11]